MFSYFLGALSCFTDTACFSNYNQYSDFLKFKNLTGKIRRINQTSNLIMCVGFASGYEWLEGFRTMAIHLLY